MKRYQDELQKTTGEGLLDSAAIISEPIFSVNGGEIFITEANGGSMLVTESQYMRKDLPKYIPQLFVLVWGWQPDKPGACFRKMIEEIFPIEKLQGMIDK